MEYRNRDGSASDRLLCAKIDDMKEKARGGCTASSAFLTPNEASVALEYLTRTRCELEYAFLGGYEDAERKMLVVFPDYLSPEYFDTDEVFRAVMISPSGREEVDHKSYLGSLMGLSVKRETIGDIVVLPEGAVVFCTLHVAAMLADSPSPLERVGRYKVSVRFADKSLCENFHREYEDISVIMASLRLDCAVGALANTSRAKAQEKIISGDVRLRHRDELSPSAQIANGDTLSIRGVGKFIVGEVCGETKSGRLRVLLKRYV